VRFFFKGDSKRLCRDFSNSYNDGHHILVRKHYTLMNIAGLLNQYNCAECYNSLCKVRQELDCLSCYNFLVEGFENE